MKYSIIVVVLLALVFSACGEKKTSANTNGEAIEVSEKNREAAKARMEARMETEKTVFGNGSYLLKSLNINKEEKTLDPNHQVSIKIFGSTVVVGSCRNFRGKFEIKDDENIAFSGLTYMKPGADEDCPSEQVELESTLFTTFTNFSSFTFSEEGEIVFTDGNTKAVFQKPM